VILMTKLTLFLDTSDPVLVDSRLTFDCLIRSMDYCDSKRLGVKGMGMSECRNDGTVHGYGLLLA